MHIDMDTTFGGVAVVTEFEPVEVEMLFSCGSVIMDGCGEG
jgi:hypothetical protein